MEELSKMDQINNLAFDLMHSEVDQKENFEKVSKIFDLSIEPQLNENQQVVLEWLKDDFKESENPVDSLESLASEVLHVETFQTCISSTYDDLSTSEQFQVLAAFAEWGMKEVAE